MPIYRALICQSGQVNPATCTRGTDGVCAWHAPTCVPCPTLNCANVLCPASPTAALSDEDLPLEKMRGTPVSMERVSEAAPRAAQAFAVAGLGEESRLDYERIVESLSLCSGNQTRAAKLLGMSRRTFCARLKAYGIPRPRGGGGA